MLSSNQPTQTFSSDNQSPENWNNITEFEADGSFMQIRPEKSYMAKVKTPVLNSIDFYQDNN